ncbi:MAG TPA: hypothetical protein VGM11_15250, partial [Acidobacteriaceae bacterium]
MNASPTAPRRRIERIDYLWLAYLVFYFIEPLERRSLLYWMESLAFAAAFLALYIAYLRLTRADIRIICIVAMYLLGVASYPTNSGAIAFFIYAAALL